MRTRETGFALCITNCGADDLEIRKVYRTVPTRRRRQPATCESSTNLVRTTSLRGDYFVFVELSPKAKRVWGWAARHAAELAEQTAVPDRGSRCSLRPVSHGVGRTSETMRFRSHAP